MIIHHLKSFFQNKNHVIIATVIAAGSSIATSAIVHQIDQIDKKANCKIEKPAYIFFKNSESKSGKLLSLKGKEILFQSNSSENLDSIPLEQIKKIIFFSDSKSFEEDLKVESQNNISATFVGKFNLIAGGHIGFLTIYLTPSGYPSGYVHFPNWGKGKIEYLSYMEISQNMIKFIRHCGGESCKEIGASYPFKQTYIGSFVDKNTIEGKYTGTHSSGTWKATRIQ